MVRVVIDTNVIVSAIVGHGRPRALVSLLLREHTVITSTELLTEPLDVLSRKKFSAIDKTQINEFLSILASKVVSVKTESNDRIVEQDPDDDVFLAVAKDGEADFIISGDPHLLELGKFGRVRILSVREMLDMLGE